MYNVPWMYLIIQMNEFTYMALTTNTSSLQVISEGFSIVETVLDHQTVTNNLKGKQGDRAIFTSWKLHFH